MIGKIATGTNNGFNLTPASSSDSRLWLFGFLAVFAALCFPRPAHAYSQTSCPAGETTSISGTVYDPAGVNPLPNILVYVPGGTVSAIADGVNPSSPALDSYANLVSGSPVVQTTTAYDGTFTLNGVPAGTSVPLVIQAGRWRRQFIIANVTACQSTAVFSEASTASSYATDLLSSNLTQGGVNTLSGYGEKTSLRFAQTQNEGDIPKMALITGGSDALECSLRKVGIADSEFSDISVGISSSTSTVSSTNPTGRINLFEGSGKSGVVAPSKYTATTAVSSPHAENTLVASTSTTFSSSLLGGYNVLLLPCQGNSGSYTTADGRGNVIAFTGAGGRIFATHYSAQYLYQDDAIKSAANWAYGAASSSATGGQPAVVNTGFTSGHTMAQWLQLLSPSTTLGDVSISTLRVDQSGTVSPTVNWVTLNGSISSYTDPVMQFTFYTPVSVQSGSNWAAAPASSQFGRVLFTEYHVNNASTSSSMVFPAECTSTMAKTSAMNGQEQMLEYSLFDLMNFAVPTITPPTIAITASPSTTFTGGQTGTLTFDVSNASASTGIAAYPAVTMTVSLPAGLTPVTMNDPTGGWSCNVSTLTCTLTKSLAASASDSVVVTVIASANVASASSSVGATVVGNGFSSSGSTNVSITTAAAPAGTVTGPANSTLANTNVGTSSPTQATATFALSSGTYLTSVKVVTEGLTNYDFTNAGTGTCVASGTAYGATTCTVVVNFSPKAPGLRLGAIQLFGGSTSSSTSLLDAAYISAIGIGPAAALTPGVISTVAGNGGSDYSGDGSAATGAQLSMPRDFAVDVAGNLYIADQGNNVIRKVTAATGVISTIAGTGTAGYSRDGSAATSAQLNTPIGVAVDGAGNLYIADTGNNVVREVSASTGIISTIAGTGTAGYSGDGGAATSAQLYSPNDLAVDGAGNLYITDFNNNVVREVSASTGVISTVAGNNIPGYSGDGGAATSAEIHWPNGLAVDGAGNLYISDTGNNVIREVMAASGIISTIAGSGSGGYAGDGGAATNAQLNGPLGVAVDAAGNVYIADKNNNVLRQVNAATQTITTVAGNYSGGAGYSGDGGPATSALMYMPWGMALDGGGNLYTSDLLNNTIRQVNVAAAQLPFATSTTSGDTDTTDGIESVTLTNIGNSTLSAVSPGLASPVDFTQQTGGGSDCTTSFSLTFGASCNLRYEFTPASSGSIQDSDPITDNSFQAALASVASTTQSLTLSGTATGASGSTATTTAASSATATYSASAQTVTLSASVSSASTVNTGTVTFTLYYGSTAIGTPATSGTVTRGAASASYTLPAGLAPGTYMIDAAYTPGSGLAASSDTTHALTVGQATPTITIANIPSSAVYSGSFTPSITYNGDGTASVTSSTPGVCTVTSGVVSFVGAGTCTLTASATAGTNYAAVTSASQSFTIADAGLTFDLSGLNFLSQLVGTTSAAQTLIVSNPNSFAVIVSGIQASGDFNASSACLVLAPLANCSVNVTFTPTSTGARTGTLVIGNAQSNLTQTVPLTGTGIAAGIVVSPASLGFGSQVVSTTSTGQTLTIQNNGTAPLLISNMAATGDFAAAGNCANVPAGSYCSVTVTFTPSAVGSRSGTLTLTDNAGGQSQSISLTGNGTEASAVLSPGALAFPSTLVGASSPALTATLTNSGSAAISGISVSLLGDFTETTSCTASLAPGASCTFSVAYAPTVAGAESGILTVSDNLGSQTVSLTGYGLAPGASLSSAQLIFGNQLLNTQSLAQTITFTNTGSSPLTIDSVTPDANFTDTTNCTGQIAAGGQCSVNVTFLPTTTGALTGTVTITDSAGTQVITAQGQGVNPGASLVPSFVGFGAQEVGTVSLAQTLTATNSGTTPLTLNPITVSNNFTESDLCPSILPVGGSCLISVSFTPTATGSLYGSLLFSDTSGQVSTVVALSGQGTLPGIATTPSTLFFGSLPVGTASQAQTVTVWNTGTAALQIASIASTGDFAETDNCTANTVPSGGYCVVNVTLTPTTTGTRTGAILITDNADGSHMVALSGVGQQAGVSVSPTSLAFGSQPYSTSAPAAGTALSVTLTNTGDVPLQLNGFSTQGDFTESDTCGSALPVGGICSLTVSFAPTALGHRTGLLTITDNAGGGVQQVSLEGDGSPYGLTLTPPVLNFGVQTVGTASTVQSATLTNNTGQALTNLVITPSGEFSETDNCGSSLANGASCTLNITVTPAVSGAITGNVDVSTGASISLGSGIARGRAAARSGFDSAVSTSSSTVGVVALTASAIPPGVSLSLPKLSFSATSVGTPSTGQTITLTNTGTALSLTSLTISGTDVAEFPFTTNCPATLAPQASCTITVNFTPNGYGLRTGILNITASGGISAALPESGTAAKGTPAVALVSSLNTTMLLGSVTFTATVSSTSAAPTGSVNFMDGSVLLGTASISSGTASLTTTALTAGTHTISAMYNGDANYVTVTSSAQAQTVLDFTLAPTGVSGASQTVVPGNPATFQLAITPTSGTTFPVAAVLSVTGLPAGATATLNTTPWTPLTATSWQVPATTTLNNVSLTFLIPAQTTAARTRMPRRGLPPFLWAALLLPFTRRLRRSGKRMAGGFALFLMLALGMAAMIGLSSCGSHNGFMGQSPQSYTVTVTVTAGTVSHSTNLTLNVQ